MLTLNSNIVNSMFNDFLLILSLVLANDSGIVFIHF